MGTWYWEATPNRGLPHPASSLNVITDRNKVTLELAKAVMSNISVSIAAVKNREYHTSRIYKIIGVRYENFCKFIIFAIGLLSGTFSLGRSVSIWNFYSDNQITFSYPSFLYDVPIVQNVNRSGKDDIFEGIDIQKNTSTVLIP